MMNADQIRKAVFEVYRQNGYTVEKDFPGEYRFFFNPETLEKARVYYNSSRVEEYR